MIHISAILLIAFLIRIMPRFIRPNAVSTDTYYHFCAADGIRKNSFQLPYKLREYLMDSPYDYPPLFHYLLSLLKKEQMEKAEKYISALVDTVHVAAVYLFSRYFFDLIFPGESSDYALYCTILFLSSPTFLSISSGPRSFQATPRVLGELFAGLTFMACFLFLFHSWYWGAAAVLCAAAALLTSKFSAQVIVFFSMIITIFTHSLFFLFLPVLAVAAAVTMSGGYYIRVLKGHLGHLYIFKKVTMRKYMTVQNKNRLKDFLSLPHDLLFNYKKAFHTLFINNTYLIVALRNPQLMLLIPIYVALIPHFLVKEPRYFLAVWILASLLCFIMTSFKSFQFLGEGNRYLEYSVLPQMILFTAFVIPSFRFSKLLWMLLLYNIVFYLLTVVIFAKIHRVNRSLDESKREVFDFLKSRRDTLRILPIGMVYELAYRTGCPILFPSGNFAINYISEKDYDELYEIYGIPNRNIVMLLDKYDLNAVFLNKKALPDFETSLCFRYDFSSLTKIFENEFFSLYQKIEISRKDNGVILEH